MCKEDIFSELKKQQALINNANKRIKELMTDLEQLDSLDWDWISVRKGADMLDISVSILYRKIENGSLNVRRIGSKQYVSISELKGIDDK
jgi:hypothetical protein